jgi:hypothetical protein
MKKWILIGIAAVFVIIVILIVLGISNLGPLIKEAVNTYGPRLTKTEVHLSNVKVSLFSGEAKLNDFIVGNPKGFTAPQAMNVGSIYVQVDKKSLTGNTIIIDKIEVLRPVITYEKKSGTDNFQTILNNVKKAVGTGESTTTQTEKQGPGKKLVIKDLIVKDGRVDLAVSIANLPAKAISAPLPEIHLKDLGEQKGGSSPAEVFKEVLAVLYTKIRSPDVTNTLTQELKKVAPNLGNISEGGKKEMEKAKEKIKGLLGQ